MLSLVRVLLLKVKGELSKDRQCHPDAPFACMQIKLPGVHSTLLSAPGLASVLNLLKEKGELSRDRLQWSGRNTDKSKVALQVRRASVCKGLVGQRLGLGSGC